MAFKMKAYGSGNSPMKKNFPDLNKDGKVTRADVLMGRGVELNSPAKKRGCKSAYKKKGCATCAYGKKKCTCM